MLELVNITKEYKIEGRSFLALNKINVYFPKSEFCSILGPSGCGKTTTLNIIGGLDKYTDGDLIIEGKSTKLFKDKDWDNYRNKRIGFVFQSYNLVSHLSLLENVTLCLTIGGLSRGKRNKLAKQALDKVGLKGLYNKSPNQLSGGQMQRVAIARALVNDPEIILADEPTGALDSVTSIQVMDILKEISKSKLVIMVTHNQDLANQYSDRIISFKDGKIIGDTKNGEEERREAEKEEYKKLNNLGQLKVIDEKEKKNNLSFKKKNKTSMSFFTALHLSLQNIRTKKGRTALVSIAASFGIIGVALVLALSNGFTNYINRVEAESAATLPVTLNSYSVTYENIDSSKYNYTDPYPDSSEIYPSISTSSLASANYSYNNFSEKYFKYLNKLRDEKHLLNDYLVNYSSAYKFHLTTKFPEAFDKSEPAYYSNVSTATSTGTINSLLGSVTGLPTTIFHELYGKEEYVRKSYDLISGSYPQNKNELVLVVGSDNSIGFNTLQKLGFYNYKETITSIQTAPPGNTKVKPISWNDVIGKEYKVYTNDEYYKEKVGIVNNGRQSYYYENTKGDGWTANRNLYEDDSLGTKLKIVGILRPSRETTLSTMSSGLCYLPSLTESLIEGNKTASLNTKFFSNASFKSSKTKSDLISDLTSMLTGADSSVVMASFNNLINDYFDFTRPYASYNDTTSTYEQVSGTMNSFLNDAKNEAVELIPEGLKTHGIQDTGFIANYLIKMSAASTTSDEFIEDILGLAAYINSFSTIQSVVVFPRDLTSKTKLLEALDEYNVIEIGSEDHAEKKSEQIFYTDMVSSFTESLTQMIDVISVVLIVLASISLVVSCVMTGIITYNTVLERTKEIGILRAIGARKKDVGRLFEAESCVIGLLSGVFGCLVAFIIEIPLNLILNAVYAEYNLGNICDLSIIHVIALVSISIVLTFISGLIPARVAAKKDPVIALRTE